MSTSNIDSPLLSVLKSNLKNMGLIPRITDCFGTSRIYNPYKFTNIKVSAEGASRDFYLENTLDQVLGRGSYQSRFKGVKTLRRLLERLHLSMDVYDSPILHTYLVEFSLNGDMLLNKAKVEVCPEKKFFRILSTIHGTDCVPFNHSYLLFIRDSPTRYSLFVATDEDKRRCIVRFGKKVAERYADEILDSEPSAFSEGDTLFEDWTPQLYCRKGWSPSFKYSVVNQDSNLVFKID